MNKTVDATFVRALRARLALSRAAFGALLGCGGAVVYQWERRGVVPPPNRVKAMLALDRRTKGRAVAPADPLKYERLTRDEMKEVVAEVDRRRGPPEWMTVRRACAGLVSRERYYYMKEKLREAAAGSGRSGADGGA